jgi:YgiT-type zinc finger domain-containing protein
MKARRGRVQFEYRGSTIFVDDVPMWECDRCGEKYFDAPVYKRLEQIALHRSRIRKTVSFPLAQYKMASG